MKRLLAAALLAVCSLGHANWSLGPFNSQAACASAAASMPAGTYQCATAVNVPVVVAAPVPVVPVVTLTGLPAASTSSTTAAIGFTVTPTASVWCRLDAYAPMVCPATFSLSGLAVGPHKVDYFLTSTATGAPAATYSWQVTAPVVTPPAITPIVSVNAKDTFASMSGHYVQLLGGQQNLTNVSETSGITAGGTVTGPMGASPIRFGKIKDPLDATRSVFYMAANASDPVTYGHLGRVEIGLDAVAGAMQKSGVTYWVASEVYIPSARIANGGDGTVIQVHNSYPPSTVTGPWLLGVNPGAIFPNRGMYFERIWSTQSNPGLSGYNIQGSYVFGSDNPSWPATASTDNVAQNWPAFAPGLAAAAWPRDQWVKVVVKYRGDPVGTTGTLQVWITAGGVTTQIVNESNVQIGTNDALAGYPTDYIKSGLDDLTGGGAGGVWELRRSVYLFQDAGYTEPQVRAQMQ